MIPNYADVRAVFEPEGVDPYTLPVVAWNERSRALVPDPQGFLLEATAVSGFARLERDVKFPDSGQEVVEEDLADATADPATTEPRSSQRGPSFFS